MNNVLEQILSLIDADAVEKTVRELVARQGQRADQGLSMPVLMERIVGDQDLGQGAQRWQALLRIKQALIAALADVPGMRYVEGDS